MTLEIVSALGSFLAGLFGMYFQRKISSDSIKANSDHLAKSIQAENERLEKTIRSEISQNNKALSLQYITDKRIDWMYAVRNELSEFISMSYFLADKYKVASDAEKRVPSEYYRDLNKSVAKLKLLLNFNGAHDKEIILLIDKIIGNLSLSKDEFQSEVFQNDIIKLTQKAQLYLKLEWERVKLETTESLTKDQLAKRMEQKSWKLSEMI